MDTNGSRTAVALIIMIAVILIPFQALALRAIQPAKNTGKETILSMGAKPAPSSNTEPKSNQPMAQGMQKISIRDIAYPIAGSDPATDAVNAVDQLLKGKTLAPGLALHAKTSGDAQIQKFGAKLKKQSADRLGNRHVRVKQTYQGIPVVGAEAIVHINDQNRIYRITGKYLPSLDISVEPAISSKDALAVGMQDLKDKTEVATQKAPELVIFSQRLAYHFVLSHKGPNMGQWQYYVDANSAEILARYTDIKSAPPGGGATSNTVQGLRLDGEDGSNTTIAGMYDDPNYFLYSVAGNWGVYDLVVDDWEQQATDDWGSNDQAAISAAKNIETAQTYVTDRLGRNSFDNAGTLAMANVHFQDDPVNAFWFNGQLWFGDGDATNSNALTVLDVVAHEFGHGITETTSNLVYQNESGALNEAYSDIFGILVEFDAQPDGTDAYPSSSDGESDWLLGEDCWLLGEALRDIRNPGNFNQPSYYEGTNWHDYVTDPDYDFGGVHINSGVLNHAFYLLAVGGSGTNDGFPYDLTGIGIEDAGRIAMQANLNEHTSADTYTDARQAWIDAAADLSLGTTAVEAAFSAVGVGSATVYRVTFNTSTGGQLTGTLNQLVTTGTDAQPITAEPDSGYGFNGWTGDYTGSENPLTLTNVTSDMTITATFAENGFTGGGDSGGGGGGSSGCFITSAVF